MLKHSLVLALAAVSVANAFFVAPAARVPTTTMMATGKATLDTLDRVVLTDDATGHSATVHLHGGCVTSYKAPHEVLGIRADAAFTGAKPIAGGLQCCWPQFGAGAIQVRFDLFCDYITIFCSALFSHDVAVLCLLRLLVPIHPTTPPTHPTSPPPPTHHHSNTASPATCPGRCPRNRPPSPRSPWS